MNHIIEWNRTFVEDRNIHTVEYSTFPSDEDKFKYASRILTCTACGHGKQAKWMQLRKCYDVWEASWTY